MSKRRSRTFSKKRGGALPVVNPTFLRRMKQKAGADNTQVSSNSNSEINWEDATETVATKKPSFINRFRKNPKNDTVNTIEKKPSFIDRFRKNPKNDTVNEEASVTNTVDKKPSFIDRFLKNPKNDTVNESPTMNTIENNPQNDTVNESPTMNTIENNPQNDTVNEEASVTNTVEKKPQNDTVNTVEKKPSFIDRFRKNPQNDTVNTVEKKPSFIDRFRNKPEANQSSPSSLNSEPTVPLIKMKSLSAAFNILYDILSLIGSILIVIYFLLALLDIIVYISRELKQKQFLIFDPNLFNKNTSEYAALKYNTNDAKNEPYNIYLEQSILSQIFRVSGLFFMVVGLQIGSFLALKLLAMLKNQEFNETIETPKNIGTILIFLMAALILNSYYKSRFLNKLQPEFKNTQTKIGSMKDYIYNNLTTHPEFLEAMLTNNITTMVQILNKQLTKYSLFKMIFTVSLYNYYKTNISENDEVFEDIRKIFTVQGIKTQNIDPIQYFYYKQNVFIPNMYVLLKDQLIQSPLLAKDGVWMEDEERNFRIAMNNRILDLNRNLLQLLKLPKKKTQLLMYLLMALFISFIFLIMIASMYKDQLMAAWAIIQPILMNSFNKITSVFRKSENT